MEAPREVRECEVGRLERGEGRAPLGGRGAERRRPEVSPLYADLAGLPPALFTVGTADPLLDDSLFMALRWRAAGNQAELAVYPESIHGFNVFPTAMARAADERIGAWLSSRASA